MEAKTVTTEDYRPALAWGTVAILMLFQCFSLIDRQIVAILSEHIKADLDLTDVQLSYLQGLAFALFYSCAGIPIGIAVDRYSRRFVLYLAISFWSLSSAGCGLASSFVGLFFGRMGVGSGEAALTPVATSLIAENFPHGRAALPMGLFSASFYVGAGMALALGGALLHWLSGLGALELPLIGAVKPWQAAFLLTGLPGLALAFLAFLLLDPREARRRAGTATEETVSLRAMFASRPQLLGFYLVGTGLLSSYTYATAAWTPAFAMRTFGWAPQQVGASIGLLVAVTGIAGCAVGGLVIDLMIRRRIAGATFLVTALTTLAAVPFYVGAYLVGEEGTMLVLLGIGMFLYVPMGAGAYTALKTVAPPGARGKMAAVFIFAQALLGAALGPTALAFITDHVIGDEQRIGEALALYGALVVPIGAGLLLMGRKYLIVVEKAEAA